MTSLWWPPAVKSVTIRASSKSVVSSGVRDVPVAVAVVPSLADDERAHGDLLVAREAERVLDADGARERLGDRGGEGVDAVVEPCAADRVVPVDLETGYGLPGVDRKRRPEVARVAERFRA